MLGSKFQRIFFLVGRVAQDVDFCAECAGPHYSKVAETADAENCDFLAWTGLCADEGRVSRYSRAHHRCGFVGRDVGGDLECEVFMGADVGCVAALGDDTGVRVRGVVGI